ncbi:MULTISPECIES: penicillin-binding protein 2 [unclassified Nocardioides]|uniref:peptidoglycan D,D-transpeptidase FtsI family protein n=1 Tax=unclassified Nocardioides TaxID=2615069 RepID=UPI002666C971|nr:penicillin-binding protein 2 [Nocardioides sp. Arc9.136]WKN50081.1 penicillin-binding protein 2 [Nocardioides sp. Arc9.136]
MRRTRPTSGRRGALRGSPQLRLRVGFILIAIVLSVFGGRLVQLQGLDPRSYAAMAAAEGTEKVVLPAVRGDIVDRNGKPLADSVDGLMVVADPFLTADKAQEMATFLARRLDVDYVQTLERLREEDSRYEYIARQVPSTLATDVLSEARELGYDGLITQRDPVREYPAGDVAANIVGALGTPDPEKGDQPLVGLELALNSWLAGTDGSARYAVGGGNKLPLGENVEVPPVDGKDVETTLDREMQWYAQRVLRQTVEDAGGTSGYAVVLDTRTGDVLALADTPTFDANAPELADKPDLVSRALGDVYEPGSVEKVLTVAGLLDAGKVTPRTKITVPPLLHRQDRPIGDWWDHEEIKLTLAGVLAKSSNIGTVLAADNFDEGQMRDYLVDFGLGSRTGLGVPGESAGILPDGSAWTSQTEDRIAFGQALSVNAMQMAAAVNTIANGGVRVDPSIIRGTATLTDGTEVGTGTATRRRVVSEQAARQTARMMELVVDPDVGVAPAAAVPGYRVAGKTGTAQRAVDGGYEGTTVSFAGFAPADEPRFTVYVVVQEPDAGGGGSVAGPAFAKLMSYALRRYGVPPTGTEPSRLPVEW